MVFIVLFIIIYRCIVFWRFLTFLFLKQYMRFIFIFILILLFDIFLTNIFNTRPVVNERHCQLTFARVSFRKKKTRIKCQMPRILGECNRFSSDIYVSIVLFKISERKKKAFAFLIYIIYYLNIHVCILYQARILENYKTN